MWSSSESSAQEESLEEEEQSDQDHDLRVDREKPTEICLSSDESITPPKILPSRKRPRPADSPPLPQPSQHSASSSSYDDDDEDQGEVGDGPLQFALRDYEYVTPLEELLSTNSQAAYMIQHQHGATSPLRPPPAAEFLPPTNEDPTFPPPHVTSSGRLPLPSPQPPAVGSILLATQASLVETRRQVVERDAEIRDLRQNLHSLQRNLERRDRDLVSRRDAEQSLRLENERLKDESRNAQGQIREGERKLAELRTTLSVERAATEHKCASLVREGETMQEGHRSREQRLLEESRTLISHLEASEQRALSLSNQLHIQTDKWEASHKLASELAQSLRVRESEIEDLHAQLGQSKQALKQQEATIGGNRQKEAELERRVQDLVIELSESRGRLAAVTAELDKARECRNLSLESGEQRRREDSLQSDLAATQSELDQSDRLRRGLENELSCAQQEIARLSRYKDALEEQLSDLLNRDDSPGRVSAEIFARNVELDARVAERDVQLAKVERLRREEGVRREETYNADLRRVQDKHQDTINALHHEREQLMQELSRLQRRYEEVQDETKRTKQQLEEASSEILDVESSRDSCEAEIEKLREKVERLVNEVRQAQNDRLSATLAAMTRNSEVSFLTGQLDREASRVRSLTEELREARDRLGQKDSSLAKMEEEVAKAGAEVERAKADMLTAQTNLKSCQWTKSMVEEEMQRLLEDLTRAEREGTMRKSLAAESLSDLQDWLRESQEENLTLRDELRIAVAEKDRLTALLLQIEERQESEAKSARLIAREIELQDLKEELSTVQKEVQTAQTVAAEERAKSAIALQALETQLCSCKEELQASHKEIQRLTRLVAQRESVIQTLSHKNEAATASIQEMKANFAKEKTALLSSLHEAKATLLTRDKERQATAVPIESIQDKQPDNITTADMEDMKRQVEALKKSNVMLRQREQSRGGVRHELTEKGMQTSSAVEALRVALKEASGGTEALASTMTPTSEVPDELRRQLHKVFTAVLSSSLVLVAAKGAS